MVGVASELVMRQKKLEGNRTAYDTRWQRAALKVTPWLARYAGNNLQPPEMTNADIFDSTATIANQKCAAVMESLLTPTTKKWHSLKPTVPQLQQDFETKTYLEEVRETLFRARYSPAAYFSSQISEIYTGLAVLGTAAMMISENSKKSGIRYEQIHMSECFPTLSAEGNVDGMHRLYCSTARQAVQRFRDKTPARIVKEAESNPEKDFKFLHSVVPNDEKIPGAFGARGWDFRSYYTWFDEETLIGNGGYRMMPYVVPRYISTGNTPYGWSPALMVLADIMTANEIRRVLLRGGQLATDPPILLPDEASITHPFQVIPGSQNFGMVDKDGRPLAIPFRSGASLQDGRFELEQCRNNINEVHLNSIFNLLAADAKVQTATFIIERSREKGILLSPQMGRQQNELLGPMIGRELDILAAIRAIPEMPTQLRELGGGVQVDYESDLALYQRAGDAAAVSRTMEILAPLIQLKPAITDVFLEDDTARMVAEATGYPMRLMRSPQMLQQLRQANQEAQAQQQQEEAQPGQAAAMRNLAMADKTMRQAA